MPYKFSYFRGKILGENIYNKLFGISNKTCEFVEKVQNECAEVFFGIEEIAKINQLKVINAFRKQNICARHFNMSTGYGYDDDSKVALSGLFACVFGAESAIVSPLIASGTHAISTALFGVLRPGDVMLSVVGKPYDTLCDAIGLNGPKGYGSLIDWGVKYKQIDLDENGKVDIAAMINILETNKNIKIAYIQRSRGYEWRSSLTVDEIKDIVTAVRKARNDVHIVVDNCYGEFSEILEPTQVGADIIIGSLIKNPGAGIAPTGAYIAGKEELVEKISYRLTAPGIGCEVGSYAASYLPYYQGLYFAPHVVSQCLKGAVITAKAFEMLGFDVMPKYNEKRGDITQAIKFNDEKLLIKYIQSIQNASIIDSAVTPIPWDMPGYDDEVIMAAGSFIQGSSIELSADGPVTSPYIAYVQGGLNFENCKLGLMTAIERMNIL